MTTAACKTTNITQKVSNHTRHQLGLIAVAALQEISFHGLPKGSWENKKTPCRTCLDHFLQIKFIYMLIAMA